MKKEMSLIKRNVVIYCASYYGEMIYCEVKAQGYIVSAFCDNFLCNIKRKIMGMDVYNYKECKKKFPDDIYIIAHKNYAIAREIGSGLEEDGLVFNQDYFIAVDLENRNILKKNMLDMSGVLEKENIVLFGKKYLCEMFFYWCKNSLKIPTKNIHICYQYDVCTFKEKYPDALWIPLAKGEFDTDKNEEIELCNILNENEIMNISKLFLENIIYYNYISRQYDNTDVKIVFLKMSCYSGSIFFSSILDSHPDILSLGYHIWAYNIWTIVKTAAYFGNGQEVVQSVISQIIEYEKQDYGWTEEYKKILEIYFKKDILYNEQEILLNIYFAYYHLVNKKQYIRRQNCSPVIYMDIHAGVNVHDAMLFWLKNMKFDIYICELIRNPIVRFGSFIKYALYGDGEYVTNKKIHSNLILNNLHILAQEKISEEEKKNKIIRLRFEDIKLHPKEVLSHLCGILNIPWNDVLLNTTMGGKESNYSCAGYVTTGFDIKPVYYPYSEYFDAFDKLRLDMVFMEKLQAYGYPFTDKEKYIGYIGNVYKLFSIPFKFEDYLKLDTDEDKNRFRKNMAVLCSYLISMDNNKECYMDNYCFGKYISAN